MEKKLCKSHVSRLRKITERLAYSQKMDGTQLILSDQNSKKLKDAEQKIYEAIRLLDAIH